MLKKTLCILIGLLIAATTLSASGTRQEELDEKGRVTISVASQAIDESYAGDPYLAFLSEKFGISFELQALTWESWDQQVNLMIAGGDNPDIMEWDFIPEKLSTYTEWAEQGLLGEWKDLDKHPNLARAFAMVPEMHYVREATGGALYMWLRPSLLYRPPNTPDELPNLMGFNFYARADWAAEVGYPDLGTTDLSLDDFYDLMRLMSQANFDGVDTVGYSHIGVVFEGMMAYFNNPYDRFYPRNGEYVFTGRDRETLEGVQWLHSLYHDGYYFSDFYSLGPFDGMGQFFAGQVGALGSFIGSSFSASIFDSFEAANPGLDAGETLTTVRLYNNRGAIPVYDRVRFFGGTLLRPDLTELEYERVMTMFDWLASPEGSDFAAFGRQGTDWTIENGEVTLLTPQDATGRWLPLSEISKVPGILTGLVREDADQRSMLDPNLRDDARDLYESYRAWQFAGPHEIFELDLDYRFFTGEAKSQYAESVRTEFNDGIKTIIVNSTNVTADFEALLTRLERRIDAVLAELNASIDLD